MVDVIGIDQEKTVNKIRQHLKTKLGPLGLELGGIWAGQPRVGEIFQVYDAEKAEDINVDRAEEAVQDRPAAPAAE